MNWLSKKAKNEFDRFKSYKLEYEIQFNKNYKRYSIFDQNEKLLAFYYVDDDCFNEFLYIYRNNYTNDANTYGDFYHKLNGDNVEYTFMTSYNKLKTCTDLLNFTSLKKDYYSNDVFVPNSLLTKKFDVSINTLGTSGMLKKYWYYPSIISYAITEFNACFIMKSKQKYFGYFYSDFPRQEFYRIDLKRAFKKIRQLQNKNLDFKQVPEKNELEIIALMM